MAKTSKKEYELLKSLRDSWKWIARDDDTTLWVYGNEPKKRVNCWHVSSNVCKIVDSDSFQFIKAEDEEPHNIAKLIEDYESEKNEMKKDKQWAISELTKSINFSKAAARNGFSAEYFYGKESGTRKAIQILGQLDEPEALSQELPAIPQFVADWIEGNKQFEEKWNDYSKEDAMNDTIHFTVYGLFADYPATNSHVELRKPVLKWLSVDRGNYFKLVNAVQYGYEVEERELTVKGVIEEHIDLLKKQEVAVNLKPYYDLWEELKDD